MKNKKQNIEQFLQDKPELGFIIGVLSKQSVIANEVWQRQSPRQSQSVNNFNQEEFIRLIKHHRLDSIFYKAVQEQNISLPTELKEKLEQINKRNKMRMMKLTAELIRIHKLFAENGIEYISLKGPALSQQIYGDYTIRSSRDLDILVRVEDFVKASDLLKSINYKNNKKFNAINRFNYKEYKFKNTDNNILVELHHRLFNNKYLLEINEDVFTKKDFVNINGIDIPVLPKKYNFKYIIIHAAAHNWKRMHWSLDVLQFKELCKDIEFNFGDKFKLLNKSLNYDLLDYTINSSEKDLQLFSKMFLLINLKKNNKYRLQEILQRLFVPYRFFD